MENISLVSVSLSSSGWKEDVKTFPCNDKEKTINIGNKYVKKTSLLVPQTNLREDIISLYSYFTYCSPDDVEEAKDILKNKIMLRVFKDKENIDNVFKHI